MGNLKSFQRLKMTNLEKFAAFQAFIFLVSLATFAYSTLCSSLLDSLTKQGYSKWVVDTVILLLGLLWVLELSILVLAMR